MTHTGTITDYLEPWCEMRQKVIGEFMGTKLVVDPWMPENRVEIRNAEGKILGAIVDLES